MKKLVVVAVFACCLFSKSTQAQQGKIDPTFNTYDNGLIGDGFDNTVRAIALQADGNLIVGGDFLNFNGGSFPYLQRINPDGEIDTGFNLNGNFNNKVYAIAIQPNGKIIVGGSFTAFSGNSVNRLVRLNQDGSLDAAFSTASGLNNIVYDIDLYPDGSAIVVGSFTKFGDSTASRIAKILPDGTLDASFSTGVGANSLIEKVIIQPDGKIILAGTFTKFNNQNKNSMVRLNQDGSIDDGFNIGDGFDNKVTAFDLQTDGKIVVVGTFLHYNGVAVNRMVRLLPDGMIDSGFQSGSGFGDDTLYTVKIDDNGNIMVGGAFTGSYKGIAVNRLVFLNPDGTLKSDFDIGAGPASSSVLTLAKSADDFWFVGGSFSAFEGQNQGRLAKIDSGGVLDVGFLTPGVGFDNSVLKILPLENEECMVFGSFSKFNNHPSSRIARLLEDGSSDSNFNVGNSGANNTIRNAVQQKDGKIIIAGNFTTYNGNLCSRLARILPNGDFDATFDTGTAANSIVYALAIQPDQKIIVAGNFTKFNNQTVGRIVRLMPDGSTDTSFNTGLGADAIIDVIAIQQDGKILAGGRFSTFNGVLSPHIVRLNADGTIDTDFAVGAGFDKNVYAIAFQSDDKIIVGGSFLTYKGVLQKRITRLLPNGNLDLSFESGSGFSKGDVRAILIQPNDRILVGGTFSGTFNGVQSFRILRTLSTGARDTAFESYLNSTLFAMTLTTNQKLLIGGNFNSVSGSAKHRIARLYLCTDGTTWSHNSWSRGFPSAGKELYFEDDYASLTTTNACSCAIDSGKIVTLLADNSLSLTYNYTGAGTLVLENSASLYQSDNDITNTGMVHLKRITPPIRRLDYTYWSSPVHDFKLGDVSPETLPDKLLSFSGKWIYEDKESSMKNAIGYAIRGPQSYSTTEAQTYTAVFKGVPNNGTINGETVSEGKKYLVGNPYPSAIDADVFLQKNAFLGGTIKFWTHNTGIAPNGKFYVYSSDDYAAYNALGGIKAQSGGEIPNGKVVSGQSFLVTAMANGTVFFDNSMRIAAADQNNQFFKTSKPNKATSEKRRIWLNLDSNKGAFKQILLGYASDASNGYDGKYDEPSANTNAFVDFYSINEGKNFVIQARGLPFETSDVIPLGYQTSVEENFTITLDQKDAFFEKKSVYLQDKKLNVICNLKEKPYTFVSQKGIFNDRFVLRFAEKTLAINTFEKTKNTLIIYQSQKEIIVESFDFNIQKILVYDGLGRLIFEQQTNQNKVVVSNLKPRNQVLIFKIKKEGGKIQTQKIVF
ncbi:delta-60 repeat domain-containing protein [Flavobacterium geliluteum]|uniref:Delta-60 repeat domain-containing protein n=1 Tax=Flavobacterium geliluteum TaxID=2816120 RepID=A0A940X734_9FLAO|nr:delta-60 repeat domain-containing protein [Flavobacterium geliluteum]MBP4138049.1 delta-60 repeat domain-containing protein [Flavobacterium geliluteum]